MSARLSAVATGAVLLASAFFGGAVLYVAYRPPLPAEPVSLVAMRFSTYLGGRDGDAGSAIALDADGYVYVAGQTTSDDFPTHRSIQPYRGSLFLGADLYLAKLTPGGDSLVYATYLGGGGDEFVTALAVDDAGRIYVAGGTTSADFPTAGAVHEYRGGRLFQSDAYIARLTADGTAVDFATYLGGTGDEAVTALALGDDGSLYVTGATMSEDFPITPGAMQNTHAGGGLLQADAFVAKLEPAGDGYELAYATYLGGRIDEIPSGLAVDGAGRAYVAGFTNSPDFPVRQPLQDAFSGPMREGEGDVFVCRLTPDGSALETSTYLGGTNDDQSTALALGPEGDVYLAGWTLSNDFPTTARALQPLRRGGLDAFLVRLSPSASTLALTYATFLGGSGEDAAHGLAVETDGGIWISGATDAVGFPLVLSSQPFSGGGLTDAFLAHLAPEGDSLDFATYLGGDGDEGIVRPALHPGGTLCVTGTTRSGDFPTFQALQAASGEVMPSGSAFVTCFGAPPAPVATEAAANVPAAFALEANYPNPFNPSTIIPFAVAQPSRVVLEVFDVTGRRVATVIDGDYAPGRYEAPFDARGLASGIYVYRIRMDDFRQARTMLLLR